MRLKAITGIMVILILFSGSTGPWVFGNPAPPARITPGAEVSVAMAEFLAFFVGIIVLELFGMEEKKKVALASATVVMTSLAAGVAIWWLTGLFPPPLKIMPPQTWVVSFLIAEFCGFLVGWIVLMLFGMEKEKAITASTIILLTSLTSSIFFFWWAGVFP